MSDAFRGIVERLRRDALAAPHRLYEEAKGRRVHIASHESVPAALAFLAKEHLATYPARDALTRDLIFEHRSGRTALWSCMLVVAYYPMLSRLRHRLISTALARDELDQVVIAAFLASLNELPMREDLDRLPMRLRQRTERSVFGYVRKEREQELCNEDDQALSKLSADDATLPAHAAPDEARYDVTLLLERAAAEGISTSSLEIIAATVQNHELLRSYVERIGPKDHAERERLYQRLKRQRSRALKRLKEMHAEMSPHLAAAVF